MQEIVLGTTVVVATSVSASPPAGGALGSSATSTSTQIVSLEQARARAGFPIRQPSHLPSPGLVLDRVGLLGVPSTGASPAKGIFQKYREDSARWLVLLQAAASQDGRGQRVAVPYGLQAGKVGEHTAAFYSHPVPASGTPGGAITITHCLWEQDGFLMELQAPHLSADELGRIGASVA